LLFCALFFRSAAPSFFADHAFNRYNVTTPRQGIEARTLLVLTCALTI
jgi:hypothetical protein